MKTGWSVLALAVGAVLLPVLPVRADTGDVAVGGELLLTIKAASSGQSIEQRTDTVTNRLPVILGDYPIHAADVHLVKHKGGPVEIRVKNRLLVTVTREDAQINQKSPWQQAQIWQQQLQQVLPRVAARPNPNDIQAAPTSDTPDTMPQTPTATP